MSKIQSQLKLARMKAELLKALDEVEAQESAHRQRGMFRTVDLAANVASANDCGITCLASCGLFSVGGVIKELERNASPALLAAMKAELKTALDEVEAQESAHRQRGMFRTVDLAANVASANDCGITCLASCGLFSVGGVIKELERNASPALLAAMKAELKTALDEVETQESAHRQRGMFRTVDLAANVAPANDCTITCLASCGAFSVRGVVKELERNASPALLAAMKAELKTALDEVEAQESALQKDDKA
ncbi:hypothetical protein ABE82_26475 (plasmid) [Paenibacillus peoriae]|uniref:hypothetical protein n=1 Tax=Paenibacillus peoriae TaxID=59893 RepID=UPI0007229DE3|nr:hypothetical protein [Paenibacillus peoriae]ALS09961.1 hypothetical protein ABE82_26475 [Paenibacillus peoriae]